MRVDSGWETLLDGMLEARAEARARDWLRARCEATHQAGPGTLGARFHMAFSSVSRQFPRHPVEPTPAEAEAVSGRAPGLGLAHWTVDQLARARLLLALPAPDGTQLARALDRLCEDADLQELIAVYQTLPLLPHPEALRERAAEGIRSNMQLVFDAVALDNPYPATQLAEGAFNQMVLKCLFVGSPLHRIAGLDGRVNPALGRMLMDYADERRAAGRSIPLELWRGIGPQAEGATLERLAQIVREGREPERLAVLLSLRGNPRAADLLAGEPARSQRLEALGERWEALLALDKQE